MIEAGLDILTMEEVAASLGDETIAPGFGSSASAGSRPASA